MPATSSTAGHAWSSVTAVALLSFVADGNGEGRVSRLVEMGGAKGLHSRGMDGSTNNSSVCFSVSKQLITRLDIEFRREEGSVDAKKICCQLQYTRL